MRKRKNYWKNVQDEKEEENKQNGNVIVKMEPTFKVKNALENHDVSVALASLLKANESVNVASIPGKKENVEDGILVVPLELANHNMDEELIVGGNNDDDEEKEKKKVKVILSQIFLFMQDTYYSILTGMSLSLSGNFS